MASSQARKRYRKSREDVDQLAVLHDRLKPGSGPGAPKIGAAALNKASVVFICSLWEAYCEDLALEATAHVVANLSDPGKLSKGTKHSLGSTDLKVWDLAGDAWKRTLRTHTTAKADNLNTPSSDNVDNLFSTGTGVSGASGSWKWQNSTADQTRKRLDKFVALRGKVAHRRGQAPVRNKAVSEALDLVNRLVDGS